MKSIKIKVGRLITQLALLSTPVLAWAGNPVVKIDFNQSGRSISQVNEIGYESWVDYSPENNYTFNSVSFSLAAKGEGVEGLKSNWYKAGIREAKLVSDGVTLDGPKTGGEIALTISGLKPGKHSLLVYFNQVDSPETNEFGGIDIIVNGETVAENVQSTVRATTNHEAKVVYFEFELKGSDRAEVIFKSSETTKADLNRKFVINALELNTPNVLDQAVNPSPAHGDEHVFTSGEHLELSWSPNASAVKHRVYFSDSKADLELDEPMESVLLANQKDTTITVSDLNSHEHYYWRVDEEKADGTVTRGDIWYFCMARLAFPGAQGYGRFAHGGRGGRVVHVTNLNDEGEGSLRHAIEVEKGPRTIVFDVSGIIRLKSRLVLSDSYVTVAGQTAPGKGICLRDAPFGLSGANDAIIQHIRVRRGSVGDYNKGLDGMGMQGSNNSIIDHCTISWTIDESFSSRSAQNISLQRTLISEALNVAGHPNYPEGKGHGYAASIGGDVGSFHHNLLAHCEGRNWSLAGGLDGNAYYSGRLDLRNNVVYNWGHRATDGGAMELNFVGNYYKPGAATDIFFALSMDHEGVGLGTQRAYFAGNVMPGHFDESNQEDGRRFTKSNNAIVDWKTFVDEPFFKSYVETQTATAAYKDVLSDVGANEPMLDEHDKRVINETLTGTYSIKGSKSGKPGLPDNEQDVGGWENYPEQTRDASWDSDGDGLPDWWEKAHGLDPHSREGDFSEANAYESANGYTELEQYLHWLSNPHFVVAKDEKQSIDLSPLFRGYTNKPVFEVLDSKGVQVKLKKSEARFKIADEGMASFRVRVTDAEGDSKVRQIGIYCQDQ